jgi:hypothetical protein
MVKTSTTSFRLDEPFLQLLEGLAAENGLSKTELVRESVTNHNRLLAEGFRNLLADVAALRERYGDNPELLCMVEMGSDGTPVGKVVIDMKHVEDVVAHPLADALAGGQNRPAVAFPPRAAEDPDWGAALATTERQNPPPSRRARGSPQREPATGRARLGLRVVA